jgi:hypothetical protein
MKKVFVAILLGLALTAFCVGPSQAAGWYICTVYSTGPVQSGPADYYTATLTDTAVSPLFTKLQLTLTTNLQKELLATMLTAVASGKKVRVYSDGVWVYAAYAGDYP